MNLVKANITGGNAKGNVLWVDKDSSLTSYNQGTWVTTYKTYGKTYGYYNLPEDKNDITKSDYYARIKTSFIEFIEEEQNVAPVDKNSMFETLVTEYGNRPLFSVITSEDGEMMKGDITFKKCKEWISEHQDYNQEFEIVMKVMETKTTKQMNPTI
jgi:hypothetical protein